MTNSETKIKIAIIEYPGSMKSAIYGFADLFATANILCEQSGTELCFESEILDSESLSKNHNSLEYQVVILPPGIVQDYYINPSNGLIQWLKHKYKQGAILCSACAGSFIIASTGLLKDREATTHWSLVNLFKEKFDNVILHPEKILVRDGDIITAGGVMAWLDLGFVLVEQFTKPEIMRQLGKILVVDTGHREQCYYQQFTPNLSHGDQIIIDAQRKLQSGFGRQIKVSELAKESCLTERTFLRRFTKATGITPSEYLQRLRVQKACDMLESSATTFEQIAYKVGYEDVSAFRKVFIKIMGLTPKEFRGRFV